MIDTIVAIWPVPPGHRVSHSREKQAPRRKLDLADLLNAGVLQPGMTLYAGGKKHANKTATLLADGYVEVDGKAYQYPGTAATVIAGRPKNGLSFFRIDRVGGRSLRDVLDDYRMRMAIDVDTELEDVADEGDAADDPEP